ncbi:hypothetical protein [Pseudomonas oryzihabitans]|uniref:hypothetical protein n=1 Tax=Pseudomonas oryzihabitans TaxID=47885 RepID=UPI001ABF1439|nr:hypothetical protein [Pseudomonas oryzihabitans]
MNMTQSCKALICAIEGELDGRHCTEEQAAAILDHALPSLTEALARVEAERDLAISQRDHKLYSARLMTEAAEEDQAQLAEAVGLLHEFAAAQEAKRQGVSNAQRAAGISRLVVVEERVVAFLARHAQVEQQEAQDVQAGEFQREDRYIVIKRKDLEKMTTPMAFSLHELLNKHLPKREYLVIESDWPEYEPTWAAIQARVEGRAALATQPAAEQLWAVHAQGPDDLFAAFSREDAEADAAAFNALPCPPGISVSAVVIESPWPAAEHWKYLAEQWKYLADKEQGSNSPPAAAHGDEALEIAQNELARTMAWVEKFKGMFGAIADGSAFYLSTAAEGRRRCQGILVRYEKDQAAMRAQAGEGGE